MFKPGKYKLYTDANKSIGVSARIHLNKQDVLHLSFLGPSYLGTFELTSKHRWLNLVIVLKRLQPLYVNNPVPVEIRVLHLIGALNQPGECLRSFNLVHSVNDNNNIYRIFNDASLQTLKPRQKEA